MHFGAVWMMKGSPDLLSLLGFSHEAGAKKTRLDRGDFCGNKNWAWGGKDVTDFTHGLKSPCCYDLRILQPRNCDKGPEKKLFSFPGEEIRPQVTCTRSDQRRFTEARPLSPLLHPLRRVNISLSQDKSAA